MKTTKNSLSKLCKTLPFEFDGIRNATITVAVRLYIVAIAGTWKQAEGVKISREESVVL